LKGGFFDCFKKTHLFIIIHELLLLNPFNSLFSRTTWVSWCQKGKPLLILLEQETIGWQWQQLDHMQIICTLLKTDNHASTHHSVFTGRMPFLPPNQWRQSTEGILSLSFTNCE